jgi:hypothetical protein
MKNRRIRDAEHWTRPPAVSRRRSFTLQAGVPHHYSSLIYSEGSGDFPMPHSANVPVLVPFSEPPPAFAPLLWFGCRVS